MEYVIETKLLTKRYGTKKAVNNMSIHVKKGDIYGLIGKNGAGKTTLMKLLLGLTTANTGEIRLFESDNLHKARRKIGSLIEAPALYKNETALENMKRFAILSETSDEEIYHLLTLVGLEKTGAKKVEQFSLGMKQRLGIAIALLGNPELLVLDEPTNGLDPAGIKEIRDIILELNKKGVTFLISSHLLDELGKIATNYGIISKGVLVEEISLKELNEKCKTSLKITVNDAKKAISHLNKLDQNMKIDEIDNTIRITTPIEDSSIIVEELVKNDVRVYEVINETQGLEAFFIERMGKK
jgi:ABC-2 type transport system ATP-binding protein